MGKKGSTIQYGAGPTHFVVRKSSGGESGSWSVASDTVLTNSTDASRTFTYAIAVDAAGKAYAGGSYNDGTSTFAVIRTNASGTWSTLPTYPGSVRDFMVTADGTLYSAGYSGAVPGNVWLVQTINTGAATPATSLSLTQTQVSPTSSSGPMNSKGASTVSQAATNDQHKSLTHRLGKSLSRLLRSVLQ
jgi:hypothetical protein